MFDETTLKEAIRVAEAAAALVTDPSLRQSAFEMTLRAALDRSNTRPLGAGRDRQQPKAGTVAVHAEDESSQTDGLQRLATDCGVSMEQLQNLIRVDNGVPQLLSTGSRENAAQQHIDLACVLLTIKHYLSGTREEKCTVLRRSLADMGVSDISHISHHIKQHPQRIRTVGKGKSMVYSLTVPTGRDHGVSVIQRLASV